MRNVRIYITPLVLVPLTVAGLCVLTAVVVYGAIQHALVVKQDPFWVCAFWTLLVSTAGAVVGGVLVWGFLLPMRRFSDTIEELQREDVASQVDSPAVIDGPIARDDLARFKRVTQRVTELLSHVEVKELFPEIVEASASMRRVLSLVERIAPSNSSVLIAGESGTGKELIAQSIHQRSLRAGAPFVAVNCAGIPEGLLESELFGHEKGAFTGAVAQRMGRFERAAGGSLFLDEIGDMPMGVQAKLLRVLQEHEVERVGGSEPLSVDVRVIAATNRDLAAMVEAGTFREDLFFRINACLLHVPPLRERDGDIPLLVDHFLKEQGGGG